MNTLLYGREFELGLLHNRVIRMNTKHNLLGMTWVYADRGMGKTTLIDSFVAETIRRQSHPTIVFKPELAAGMFGLKMFAESMFRSAVACPSSLALLMVEHANQFVLRLNDLRSVGSSSIAGYSSAGTVRRDQVSAVAVAKDPKGEQLAELFVESLAAVVEQFRLKSRNSQVSLRVVLCLDQFSDYAPSVKRWIGAVLIQSMMLSPKLTAPCVILTGREPMESSGQIDYWEVPFGRIDEIELKSISRSGCIKWLVDEGIQPDVIDELMERTKGVPLEIYRLIADKKSIRTMETEVQALEASGGCSVRQRRWLHAAALLEQVDYESLSVLLGETDGQIAFDWLQAQDATEGVDAVAIAGAQRVFIAPELSSQLLEEGIRRYPDRHEEFTTKIALQKRLLKKIPLSAHRDYLRRLVAIEPFDFELINKIYGGYE